MHTVSLLALLAPVTTFAATIATRDLSPATNLPTGWSYAGCYIDTVTPRSLSSASTYDSTMTGEQCVAFCSAKGYNVAGTEYGAECYCGSALPNPAPEASDCNKPCAGDSTQACGAGYRLSLYQNPSAAPAVTNPGVDGWQSLGCVSDSQQQRTLPNFTPVDGPMTVAKCVAACQANNYGFGGVEYSQECWCGNDPTILPTNDPSQCFMPCKGNLTEFCGGPNALNIYSPIPSPPDTVCQPLRADGYGLITNGGFENGFTGWTPNTISGTFAAGIDTEHQLEGCDAAYVSPISSPLSGDRQLSISQTISTPLIPNAYYRFTGFQGRLPPTLNNDSPTIAVNIGSQRLGEVVACQGDSGCKIQGQNGARYTEHIIPFQYLGQQTQGVVLSFYITWTSANNATGNAELLFDGFNLVQTSTLDGDAV